MGALMPAPAWRAGRRGPKREKQKRVETKSFRPFIIATMPADVPPPSGSGFHLGIEIGDHIFERRNRLLNRRNLNQFPAGDRALAVLQRDDQIPPLLLE